MKWWGWLILWGVVAGVVLMLWVLMKMGEPPHE